TLFPYTTLFRSRFCHAVEFGVGAAFDVIVALQFERDIVRPALGAIDKAVVEGGHSSWRIYTKCVTERSAWGPSAADSSDYVQGERRGDQRVRLGLFGCLRLFSIRDCFAELVDGGNLGRPQTILGDVPPDCRRVQWSLNAAAKYLVRYLPTARPRWSRVARSAAPPRPGGR